MINITVSKINDTYVPSLKIAPNATFSLREVASLIHFLQNGVFAEKLFEQIHELLDDQQLADVIKYISTYYIEGNLSDDKKMMESLLAASKIPVIDNESHSNE